MIWTLILFAHVGALGDGNSNALTNITGFKTQQSCQAAGQQAKTMAGGSVKRIEFVCVKDQ